MRHSIPLNEIRQLIMSLRGSTQHDGDKIERFRSLDPQFLRTHIVQLLDDDDVELRCQAALAAYYVGDDQSLNMLLPKLADPEWGVRVQVCGLLHDLADNSATQSLVNILKNDPKAMVRQTAAYALGGIKDPCAIPALIEVIDNDFETDELGHTPSSSALTALDEIMGTEFSRIKSEDGLCEMQPRPGDLEELKRRAVEFYQNS